VVTSDGAGDSDAVMWHWHGATQGQGRLIGGLAHMHSDFFYLIRIQTASNLKWSKECLPVLK
jgi:hypothetical protein